MPRSGARGRLRLGAFHLQGRRDPPCRFRRLPRRVARTQDEAVEARRPAATSLDGAPFSRETGANGVCAFFERRFPATPRRGRDAARPLRNSSPVHPLFRSVPWDGRVHSPPSRARLGRKIVAFRSSLGGFRRSQAKPLKLEVLERLREKFSPRKPAALAGIAAPCPAMLPNAACGLIFPARLLGRSQAARQRVLIP